MIFDILSRPSHCRHGLCEITQPKVTASAQERAHTCITPLIGTTPTRGRMIMIHGPRVAQHSQAYGTLPILHPPECGDRVPVLGNFSRHGSAKLALRYEPVASGGIAPKIRLVQPFRAAIATLTTELVPKRGEVADRREVGPLSRMLQAKRPAGRSVATLDLAFLILTLPLAVVTNAHPPGRMQRFAAGDFTKSIGIFPALHFGVKVNTPRSTLSRCAAIAQGSRRGESIAPVRRALHLNVFGQARPLI